MCYLKVTYKMAVVVRCPVARPLMANIPAARGPPLASAARLPLRLAARRLRRRPSPVLALIHKAALLIPHTQSQVPQ